MMQAITPRFYPSVVTFQSRSDSQDSYGQPVETWSNVSGLVDLPCSIAPTGGSEPRSQQQIVTVGTHRIALTAVYPVVTAMRAVIGGVHYNILTAETDSQENATYCNAEIVS
jgi:head-tail adaptor